MTCAHTTASTASAPASPVSATRRSRGFAALIFVLVAVILAPSALALTPTERQIVSNMKTAVTQLRGKLAEAETANREYLNALTKAKAEASALHEQASQAAIATAQIAAERDEVSAQLAAANVRYEKLNKRYQTAELIIAISVGIIALITGLQLGAGLPPQYRLAVGAGCGLAAAGAVYIFL